MNDQITVTLHRTQAASIFAEMQKDPASWSWDAIQGANAIFAALIAPTPAPGEPTAAEIDAAAKAIRAHGNDPSINDEWDDLSDQWRATYHNLAKAALAAARAARATGASER